MQFMEAQTELSGLKEKCKKCEHEKQLLSDQLEEYKANMEDLQEKGSKVRICLSKSLQEVFFSDVTCVNCRKRNL